MREPAPNKVIGRVPPAGFRLTLADLFRVTGIGVAIIGAAVLALGALALTGIGGSNLLRLSGSQTFVMVATVVQVLIMVGTVRFIGMRRRGMSWRDLGLIAPTRSWVWVSLVIAVLCIPLISGVTAGFQLLLGHPISSPQARLIAPEGFTWAGAVGMVLLAGLAAPFAEEIFFRGLLYGLLRRYWGVVASVTVSALLFGAVHGILDVLPGTAVMGAVLAIAYERSGTLWVPVTIHAMYNSLSLILLFAALHAGLVP